jgi:hypothetical protein
MYAGGAIPPDTFLYREASKGEPIGVARDWIAVEVHRHRAGWSEVTIGADRADRVWVRSERVYDRR